MSSENKTTDFNNNNRSFKKEGRKMISMRLPESMVRELKTLAEQRGWTVTDVVQAALDQYIQWSKTEGNNQQKAA